MPALQDPKPYQKPNGHWYYRIRTADGHRPQRGPFRTEREAKRAAKREAAAIELARDAAKLDHSTGETADHTLRELIAEFKQLYKGAPKTVAETHRLLGHLETAPDPADSRRLFVDRSLRSILPADITKFMHVHATTQHKQMKWTTLWSSLLKTAEKDLRWLTAAETPREALVWPKIAKPRNRALWYSPEQVLRIAQFMPEPYRYVPEVELKGGFRTGEAIALRPSWIDWDERTITLQHASWNRRPSPGKRGAIPRPVPLTRELEAALRAIPPHVWSDEMDLCFTQVVRGQRVMLHGGEYARLFRIAVAESGETPVEGTRIDPYSLRHTHINWHMEAGAISVSDLADYLGTSIEQIEASYNRQTSERRQRNAERLDDTFRAIREAKADAGAKRETATSGAERQRHPDRLALALIDDDEAETLSRLLLKAGKGTHVVFTTAEALAAADVTMEEAEDALSDYRLGVDVGALHVIDVAAHGGHALFEFIARKKASPATGGARGQSRQGGRRAR